MPQLILTKKTLIHLYSKSSDTIKQQQLMNERLFLNKITWFTKNNQSTSYDLNHHIDYF